MGRNLYTLKPPTAPIHGEMLIPGSKSYTNRALVIAALGQGVSELLLPSLSDDSLVMIKALRKFGVEIEEQNGLLKVFGRGRKLEPYRGEINIGAAGTTMRFLLALCAFVPGCEVTLLGSTRMHERPIGELVEALRSLGIKIEYLGEDKCPPLKIYGASPAGFNTVKMRGDLSSQYFSSLLLSAVLLEKGLTIEVEGEQISRSYIDMTVSSLQAFGIEVLNDGYKRYVVRESQSVKPTKYQVEGDASGASYFWGLAALSGGRVRAMNINPDSAQGDVKFPDLLEKMGCRIEKGSSGGVGWIEVHGTRTLSGIDVNMELMPDTAQTLAVVAAAAQGPSIIEGLVTLRIKETDRIAALIQELVKIGIETEHGPDWIKIIPGPLKKARISTYDDHRMAMSFAMLGSVLDGLEIEDPEVVSKSFPGFWENLRSLGIGII